MAISTKNARDMLKNTGDILKNAASDLLSNSDFISRTIGMTIPMRILLCLYKPLEGNQLAYLVKTIFIYSTM